MTVRKAIVTLFAAIAVVGVSCAEMPDGITVSRDIRYAPAPEAPYADASSDRLLDLYMPESGNGGMPVVVFIHGGGFSGGDKHNEVIESICADLAGRGYAAVSANYRLYMKYYKVDGQNCQTNMQYGPTPQGHHYSINRAVETASEDIAMVLGWIAENAEKYGFNKEKVAVMGGSAGGMTALYTAYVHEGNPLPVSAVANLWGGLEDAAVIGPDAPPLRTYHGDRDELISAAYSVALKERMDAVGVRCDHVILENTGHAAYKLIADKHMDGLATFFDEYLK